MWILLFFFERGDKRVKRERFVYRKIYNDYGKIRLTIKEVMRKRNITTYRLSVLTGINWSILKRYTRGTLYRVDLDILSRICYALNCSLDELICYEQDIKKGKNIQKNKCKNKNL